MTKRLLAGAALVLALGVPERATAREADSCALEYYTCIKAVIEARERGPAEECLIEYYACLRQRAIAS